MMLLRHFFTFLLVLASTSSAFAAPSVVVKSIANSDGVNFDEGLVDGTIDPATHQARVTSQFRCSSQAHICALRPDTAKPGALNPTVLDFASGLTDQTGFTAALTTSQAVGTANGTGPSPVYLPRGAWAPTSYNPENTYLVKEPGSTLFGNTAWGIIQHVTTLGPHFADYTQDAHHIERSFDRVVKCPSSNRVNQNSDLGFSYGDETEDHAMWTAENRARYNRDHLRYPSDLTDQAWVLIEPFIPPAKPGGNKRSVVMREVVNGMMYA